MSRRAHPGWGAGIVLAFVVFVAGLAVMVTASVSSRVDLVADDYYGQGIRHQERIDALEHGRRSAPALHVTPSWIDVRFPPQVRSDEVQGEIALYRPSDRRMDRSIPLRLDSTGTQRLAAAALARGLWHVKISWRQQGRDRFAETRILLE